MNYQAIWDETVLRGRLQYIKFKKLTWLMETLLFLLALCIAVALDMPAYLAVPLVTFTALRAVTEAVNHNYLALYHNVADQYKVLWPFH